MSGQALTKYGTNVNPSLQFHSAPGSTSTTKTLENSMPSLPYKRKSDGSIDDDTPSSSKSLKLSLPPSFAQGLQQAAPLDPKAHWITPKEQFEDLHLPIAKEISRSSPLFPHLGKVVAQYVGFDDEGLEASATWWYTGMMPERERPTKIPPLPKHIYLILNSKCPFYGDLMQPYLKIKDTHLLSLVSEKSGRLNPPESGYWVLMTERPGINNKIIVDLTKNEAWCALDPLQKKPFIYYEISTLEQDFAAITINMVATREKHCQGLAGYRLNQNWDITKITTPTLPFLSFFRPFSH